MRSGWPTGSTAPISRFARSKRSRTPSGRRLAVHDLDPPAGGEPEAPLRGADDDARRPAPVRARLHHLHAHGLDDAVRDRAGGRPQAGTRALRRRLRPRFAPPVRPQGEERAGGARGDPSRGRALPTPGRGARASSTGTSRRCTSSSGCAPSPRRWPTRAGRRVSMRLGATSSAGRRCRVRRQRHGDHLPRLPRRLRGGPRRRARRRRGAPAAAAQPGRRREGARARAAGARDLAARLGTPRRRS